MSYNIFSKKAAFQGTTKTADGDIVSGTIEYMVDNHSNQTVNGQKTFTDLSASNISIGERISHTGDSDTRIQFGTDNISFMADGGTQIFTIYGNLNPDRVQVNNGNLIVASGGKIGIGVLTPSFELEVSGDISGSGTFHNVGAATFGNNLSVTGTISGNGSGLTNVGLAGNLLAESIIGSVSGSQISASNGLSTSGNNLVVQVSGAASGLVSETNGIKIDLTGLSTTSYSDNDYILISASAGNRKMQVSTLESGFDSLAASQVTSGRFNTARLPVTIETQTISASVSISGALFQGDGRLLTGVTSTPAPAGANTQLQFNDDAAFAGDADLTFLTGSNTLATSNVSASVNLSGSSLWLQDEIYVGGQAFLNIESNVVANNASFTEITASSEISSSADVYGLNFRGNGSTLNNVPLGSSNAASIVFIDNETNKTITTNAAFTFNGTHAVNTGGGFKGTTLSASANVQVGGHITGSGNIVLTGSSNSIIFDMASNDGPSITSAGENVLTIDGDNTLKLRGDNYVTIQENTTDKFNFNFSTDKMVTAMLLSSSAPVSASMVDSLTGYKLGNQAIVDSNANLTVGLIGSQNITIVYDDDESPNALDFGAGAVSGSGNISGSAIHFEHSLNLGSNPLIDANANATLGQLTCFVDTRGNTSLPTDNSRATFYVDEGANKFFVYVRYSDGTTKSGSIGLT